MGGRGNQAVYGRRTFIGVSQAHTILATKAGWGDGMDDGGL